MLFFKSKFMIEINFVVFISFLFLNFFTSIKLGITVVILKYQIVELTKKATEVLFFIPFRSKF